MGMPALPWFIDALHAIIAFGYGRGLGNDRELGHGRELGALVTRFRQAIWEHRWALVMSSVAFLLSFLKLSLSSCVLPNESPIRQECKGRKITV